MSNENEDKKIDVWYAIPTANPVKARTCFDAWRAMGYQTAGLFDEHTTPAKNATDTGARVSLHREDYFGYPWAVNELCRYLIAHHGAQIIVTGGDDIFPDPDRPAGEIAAEFIEHFGGTFGVMQPTGDRWMWDGKTETCASERICGSPWMGRAFVERINGGRGPFWPEYFHFECDVELKEVAEQLGVLWQRQDLTQEHRHWSRPVDGKRGRRPEYLVHAHTQAVEARKLVETRRANGWPGHEPLSCAEGRRAGDYDHAKRASLTSALDSDGALASGGGVS